MTPARLPEYDHSLRRRLLHANPAPAGCLDLGHAYLRAPDESGSLEAQRLYAAYSRETDALFRMVRLGVEFTERDPYASADQMRDEVAATRTMRVYSGGSEHPRLSEQQNLRGRAVHDLLAHLVCGCPFTATGEFNAFEAQAALYSVEVRPLLFCEIVAQTCAYLAQGGKHAEQKVVFFSPEDEVAVSGMRRQFKKGLGLAGVVERGWVDRRVFEVAERTGYALRYAYAILEDQSKREVEALLARRNPWDEGSVGEAAPLWAKFLRGVRR